MNLLKVYLSLIALWRTAFCKYDTYLRIREHAIASICSLGRHTITNLIIWLNRDQVDHSADYRLYNEYKWNVEDLFNPLLEKTLEHYQEEYIIIGADDTRIRKTGKKIPGTSWGRDPLSPPFQVNFMWGQRFLQFSCLLPLYKKFSVGPRAVPVRFIHTPPLSKPGKKASDEEKMAYKERLKKENLSTRFVSEVKSLREYLNTKTTKKLLMVCDGSFCNKICMNMNIPNTEIIARTRKDSKLCFRDLSGGRKTYSSEKFTPEQVRQNETIEWTVAELYYGGEIRKIRFKEVKDVLWQSGTKIRPMRLIVVSPLPYVKRGVRNYRQPAYLLCTDEAATGEFLLQSYLDRWQIEVNFREEKSILGVGEAQVWNENAVYKQPAFRVACYSALLLASIITFQDGAKEYTEEPKWRDKPKRYTCRALVGILRSSLLENIEQIFDLGLTRPMISAIFRKAA